MKNTFRLSLSVALFGLVTTAGAATLNCAPSSVTLTAATASYAGGSLFYPGTMPNASSVVCGDVTFSNFQVFDAAPPTSTGQPLVLLSGTYDGSTTTLSFNPNLNDASVNQDLHLLFNVSATTSMIFGVGLGNGGSTNSGINERLCSGSVDPFSGICSGGTTLATLTAAGGSMASATLTTPSQMFNVYKDLGHPAGGELTGFTQSFTAAPVSATNGDVPEPATLAMLGGGLVVLALVRRKKLA